MPLVGSSRKSSSGIAEEGVGQSEALLHAEGVSAEFVVSPALETDPFEQGVYFVGGAASRNALEVEKVLTPGEVGVEGRGLDDRADTVQGCLKSVGGAEEVEAARGGRTRPSSMLMVVVLPEPLGPSSPKTCPRGTDIDRPSTATMLP